MLVVLTCLARFRTAVILIPGVVDVDPVLAPRIVVSNNVICTHLRRSGSDYEEWNEGSRNSVTDPGSATLWYDGRKQVVLASEMVLLRGMKDWVEYIAAAPPRMVKAELLSVAEG